MVEGVSYDLFGEIPAGAAPRVPGRGPKGGKHYTVPRGYVMRPGTGPAGETCGSCEHLVSGRGGRYRKCVLAKATWTNGPRTDVLSRSPACSKWEKSVSAV